jgi:RNA-directed DNA polymerase
MTPVRRVYIPKPGKTEQRPLGIPTMSERAKQCLVKAVLEPEWEAKFEPNSYGFRPGRSCHDAIEAIFKDIRLQPKYVLDADIAGCFDHISHEQLLQKLHTIPILQQTIKRWLKAGVMEEQVFRPTESGTPQGGTISPLLANIALHGMEEAIQKAFTHREGKPHVVRYADDFLVFHKTQQGVEKAKRVVEGWLQKMELMLKPSKTRITHSREGFDFLGCTIQQYPVGKNHSGKQSNGDLLGFKTIIKPSKEAIARHLQEIAERCKQLRAVSQERLIKVLNPIIGGWSNYYRTVVSKEIFADCDHQVYELTQRWAKHKHANKGVQWRQAKYWGTETGEQSTFQTSEGTKLRKHSDTPIRRHTKVQGTASPYDGKRLYWTQRLKNHPMTRETLGRLLQKQNGKCKWCGLTFTGEDRIEIDHTQPRSQGGSNRLDNKAALHLHCHDQRHGIHDKDSSTEEPCALKDARTVLKTSRGGDSLA